MQDDVAIKMNFSGECGKKISAQMKMKEGKKKAKTLPKYINIK